MSVVDNFRVVRGKMGVNPTVDKITSTPLQDGAVVEWDVKKSPNATVRLDHNLATRLIAKPYNIKAGEKYTLTLIQDKEGGAAVTFDSAFNIASSIKTDATYKTTIILLCEGSGEDLKLNSKMVSYSVDKNQLV